MIADKERDSKAESFIGSASFIKVGKALSNKSFEENSSSSNSTVESSSYITMIGDDLISNGTHADHFSLSSNSNDLSNMHGATEVYGSISGTNSLFSPLSEIAGLPRTSSSIIGELDEFIPREAFDISDEVSESEEAWVDVEPWEKLDDEVSPPRKSKMVNIIPTREFCILWVTFFCLLVLAAASTFVFNFKETLASRNRAFETAADYSSSISIDSSRLTGIWSLPRCKISLSRTTEVSPFVHINVRPSSIVKDSIELVDSSTISPIAQIFTEDDMESNIHDEFGSIDKTGDIFRDADFSVDPDEIDFLEWRSRCDGSPPQQRVLRCDAYGLCSRIFETRYRGPGYLDYEPCPSPLLPRVKLAIASAANTLRRSYRHADQDWDFYPPMYPLKSTLNRVKGGLKLCFLNGCREEIKNTQSSANANEVFDDQEYVFEGIEISSSKDELLIQTLAADTILSSDSEKHDEILQENLNQNFEKLPFLPISDKDTLLKCNEELNDQNCSFYDMVTALLGALFGASIVCLKPYLLVASSRSSRKICKLLRESSSILSKGKWALNEKVGSVFHFIHQWGISKRDELSLLINKNCSERS